MKNNTPISYQTNVTMLSNTSNDRFYSDKVTEIDTIHRQTSEQYRTRILMCLHTCTHIHTHMFTGRKGNCCQHVFGHGAGGCVCALFVLDTVDTGTEPPFHIPLASDEADFHASGSHVHTIYSGTDHCHHHPNATMVDPLYL